MNTQNNTGLGLIKTTIERVQNEDSLFNSALKKLVNSNEEELNDFLQRKFDAKDKNNILRLISGGQTLILRALTGGQLICQSKVTFKSGIDPDFVNWGLNKTGIATQETLVQVHEMTSNGTFMDIFGSLPGKWSKKWVSQNQVVEFCKTLAEWLRQDEYSTMFLVKIDENKPVKEDNPPDNLVVVYVRVHSAGLDVYAYRLERDIVWYGEYRHRVVSPQLISSAS